jgi:hypothetical protein
MSSIISLFKKKKKKILKKMLIRFSFLNCVLILCDLRIML